MTTALILYGSRARGEAGPRSDVDLILAEEGNDVKPATFASGVSVHRYTKGWLTHEAEKGNLFSYHVAFEGVSLHDTDDFLLALRRSFRKKLSYKAEIGLAALILKYILEQSQWDNDQAKRRYFWSIRTILICRSAEMGTPLFASQSLEDFSGIEGLSNLINNREKAKPADCFQQGQEVLRMLKQDDSSKLTGSLLRKQLMESKGIGMDTVRILEERQAIEIGSMVNYM